MGVINVLPTIVINKIAAGEVIERPASVIKELVENALDAGAGAVSVEVEDGGKKLIRVVDDGFGMGADDLALAFSSHATSKLKAGEDLFFIQTLGFRGEALASIGSVSHARIVSRLRGAMEGGEVEVNGGAQEGVRAKGAPEGTTVEVRDLFFNVPARRKFLKSSNTEFAHIVELVSRVALAVPDVSFKLLHNGREVLGLQGGGGRRRRLGDLYGPDVAEGLIAVDSGDGPIHVDGFAAPPAVCRSNAKLQMTYVNGRFIRDRSIHHAIAAGYEGRLMRGQYPVVFLFLQTDPREVDVNVHPTKIEVRFRQAAMVHQTVMNAVREALRGADLTPRAEVGLREERTVERPVLPERPRLIPEHPRVDWRLPERTPPEGAARAVEPLPISRADFAAGAAAARAEAADHGAETERPETRCFQVSNSYIIEERAAGIAIIDQHALHERILFSEIEERLGRQALERQRLLIPAVVHLGKGEAALLLAEQENLLQLGIELSEFGGDSIAVNALPTVLGRCAPEQVVHDLLSMLSGDSRNSPVESRRLEAAKMIACKAAIKAGDRLTESEMRSLLAKGRAISERDTCPHGRPVCIFLPFADLDRQFKRG